MHKGLATNLEQRPPSAIPISALGSNASVGLKNLIVRRYSTHAEKHSRYAGSTGKKVVSIVLAALVFMEYSTSQTAALQSLSVIGQRFEGNRRVSTISRPNGGKCGGLNLIHLNYPNSINGLQG